MVINVELRPKDGEPEEKFIRRFFKKCKKLEIIREHLDKTTYHRTRARKRREKTRKNKFLKNKENL